jgi:O-antigen/teichoic acid export membrane protein
MNKESKKNQKTKIISFGKSVKINMIMNALLTMSSFIFPLITFPYVSRILTPVGTGKVNFATSVISYFSMFAQLGIPTYGIRACAKVRDDKEKLSKTVQELLIINLFMCLLVYAVFGITLIQVPRFREELPLFLIMGISIGLNALGVEWLYKALEQYTYITVRSILFKFIALLAMFALIHGQNDYVIYGGITIFAASASNILNFFNLRKHISFKPTGDYRFRQHISMILVFFAMSVATTIYTNLDNVMLGFMKTDADVGYYGAAVKIKQILVSLVTSASAVLLPRASYYVDKGLLDDFYAILKKTMHFILLIALPMVIYFMIFAREGILFLSGDAYEGSILPMQIIMPTLVLIGMTNVIGIQMLVPLGMEKQVLYSEIAGAIVDLIINLILIPKYAAAGAAFGTLVAEFVVLLWQMAAIRNIEVHLFADIRWWKLILANGVAIMLCFWTKQLLHGNFIILAVSAICFFGGYGITLLATGERLVWDLLKQMVFAKIKNH